MKNRLIPAFVAVLFVIYSVFAGSVSAKDDWISVQSQNFKLIGNASEKDIRKAATKLEQFRESFRLIFAKTKLSSSIPTNVVVFKNDSAYKPFKPKRDDGKIDNFVAGYFQPGEDVNYITLSAGGDDSDTFGTIFHEYVHFIVDTNFGRSEIPAWFNEGLAEYYQTFAIEKDIKIKLGLPQSGHLMLLKRTKLLPLADLLTVSNYSLHQNGNHSRSIFYAQSWALIHYLVQTGKSDGMNKFLNLSLQGMEQEKAFTQAFQMSYGQMERELRKYVDKATFQYAEITFKQKLEFESSMRVSPLSDADINAYLGDLLYHTNRFDDSEPYLLKALELDPNSAIASTALGMVKFRQRKFDDAKRFLEAAVSGNSQSHIAHYRYAYILSRSGRDEFGYVGSYPPETTDKIRNLLSKAIALNPEFTESYELFAFVSLVNNEELDESIAKLRAALKYQPGNQRYSLRMAEVYLRQKKFKEAEEIAAKISRTAAQAVTKQRADNLVAQILQIREMGERKAEAQRRMEEFARDGGSGGGEVIILSDEQSPREEEFELISINRQLREAETDEQRVIGRITKIECVNGKVVYRVNANAEAFELSSTDFESLTLTAFHVEGSSVGCDSDISTINAVLTYRPSAKRSARLRGELVSIEFVPDNFRFVEKPTLKPGKAEKETSGLSSEERNRQFVTNQIRKFLGSVPPGGKRIIGLLEERECVNDGTIYNVRTGDVVLRLIHKNQSGLIIRSSVKNPADMQLGCGGPSIDVKAVITYRDVPEKKLKTDGELVSIDFVPAYFLLDQS